MLERIEKSFRSLVSALQIAKLYGLQHAKFAKALDAAFEALQAALAEQPEIVFGIIGEELAFEKEILFDLSKSAKSMILYLKTRGIERLSFNRAVRKEELKVLLEYLFAAKDQVKHSPQEYLSLAGVRNISIGRISDPEGTGQPQEAMDYLSLYANSLETCQNSIETVMAGAEMDSLGLKFNIANIFESLVGRHQELLRLTALKRYDATTFNHILNVSILSMFFASRIGLSRDEVLEIGTAALFHDVGKMFVSRTVIRKADRLTDEEFETIKGHTVFGAEMLLKYVDDLGVVPVLVAFEHHVKADHKGYPKIAFPRPPHVASVIVAICDVYDALFSRRSYKAGLAPNVIHEIMMKEKLRMYRPEMVDLFFRLMGVWPVGCIVALSDGRVAVVREANETDIFSPKVDVVSAQGVGEKIDLSRTKPGLVIQKALDPATEGKAFAALV